MTSPSYEPPWMILAKQYIGVEEIQGPRHNPTISKWLYRLGAWWRDDETPWCGAFVAAILQESGMSYIKHWYRARAWVDWGVFIPHVAIGAVVVYERGPAQGHVGFIAGLDDRNRILTLGGNQGNRVTITPFNFSRVIGIRWPTEAKLPAAYEAIPPMASSNEPDSTNEA